MSSEGSTDVESPQGDNPSRGGLVIISGPSGSGKTSICRELYKHPQVTFSVSATTRAPRPDEKNGKDYHFITREEFKQGIAQGDFVEWAEVYGNLYGSFRAPLIEAMSWKDRYYIMEIDVQGAIQLQDKGYLALYLLVLPPSLEELRSRLEKRGTDDKTSMTRRLAEAAAEMEKRDRYDQVILNDDLDTAILRVHKLLELTQST